MTNPQVAFESHAHFCKPQYKSLTFDTDSCSFASDLYGHLQWLAYRLAIVNAHTDLPLTFYVLHTATGLRREKEKNPT